MRGLALLAGSPLACALRQGFFLHTVEREVALFEGALALSAGDLAEGAASECGLQPRADLRAIQKAGFLREYVWPSRRPSHWADPGDLRPAAPAASSD